MSLLDLEFSASSTRKAKREIEWQDERTQKIQNSAVDPILTPGVKRKRGTYDEADPKLQEFLEVMQPASKPKSMGKNAPPIPSTSDSLPVKSAANNNAEITHVNHDQPGNITQPLESQPYFHTQRLDNIPRVSINSTDEDWLRSRTSRTLDVLDSNSISLSDFLPKPRDTALDTYVQSCDNDNKLKDQSNVSADNIVPGNKSELESTMDSIRKTARLFVRNLPYTASEADLRSHFLPYGPMEEVHLPVDSTGASKGFAYIQYSDSDSALQAFHNLDGEAFQGRLLHILPGLEKRENKLDDIVLSQMPVSKQRQIKRKSEAAVKMFNWNSLYMDQDAVNSVISKRLGVSKSELLDPTCTDSAWKQAVAETAIIQETKAYFTENGVDLDSFKNSERGDTCILVKKIPHGMTVEELRKMFEDFGKVLRVLMPPAGTIAIVELDQPVQARAAFASLAYRRVRDSVLFLEKAPKNLFTSVTSNRSMIDTDPQVVVSADSKISAHDLLEQDVSHDGLNTSTLYVRNLNFVTSSQRLTEIFRPLDGFLSARVNTKPDPKKPGQVLSMGFGFLEFKTKSQAEAALLSMNGFDLDGHKLVIKISHKGVDAAEERRRADQTKKDSDKKTKIIIKNLPFETTKKDVRGLFSAYGKLRSVRVPKKFDNTTRGFAFAEFITPREAENALKALRHTHLLGRRLVLEFASSSNMDAEEEIERMQKKVTAQVNKVAVQSIIGSGRRKFILEDGADEQ